MAPTVYLVSGATRGIGLGLVTALAQRSDTIIFAGARTPSSATALNALAEQHPGKVHVVQLTSGDKADNDAAIAKIKEIAGRVDVVIANAGISQFYGSALDTPADQMRIHYEVNVIGNLTLFQSTYALLTSSTSSPKFLPMSSGAGSITHGTSIDLGLTAYGSSKAALNYLARRLHFENANTGLVCFAINPGLVETDQAQFAVEAAPQIAALFNLTPVETSVQNLLKIIDGSTREKDGGKFVGPDGNAFDW